jgi:hypothetical protein
MPAAVRAVGQNDEDDGDRDSRHAMKDVQGGDHRRLAHYAHEEIKPEYDDAVDDEIYFVEGG